MGYADAVASYTGTFTATQAYFTFNYNMTTSAQTCTNPGCVPGWLPPDPVGWLTIKSLTGGTTLADISFSTGSNAINVALPYGHDIEVFYGLQSSAAPSMFKEGGARQTTMTFNTSVVPEPISSILFVAGGTLLAGRRFIKRKKKA